MPAQCSFHANSALSAGAHGACITTARSRTGYARWPRRSPEAGTGGRCPRPARCIGGEAHAGSTSASRRRLGSGRCGARALVTASLPLLISLALDEVDATDVRRRLRENAAAGRTEAIVADDLGLGRPDGCFVADAFVGQVEPRTSGIAARDSSAAADAIQGLATKAFAGVLHAAGESDRGSTHESAAVLFGPDRVIGCTRRHSRGGRHRGASASSRGQALPDLPALSRLPRSPT